MLKSELLEHARKIVQRILERQMRLLISLNKMQLGFMPRKGTVDAIYIVKKYKRNIKRTRSCIGVVLKCKRVSRKLWNGS